MFQIVAKPEPTNRRIIHSSEGQRGLSLRNLLKLKKTNILKKNSDTIYQLQKKFLQRRSKPDFSNEDQFYNFLGPKNQDKTIKDKEELFNVSNIIYEEKNNELNDSISELLHDINFEEFPKKPLKDFKKNIYKNQQQISSKYLFPVEFDKQEFWKKNEQNNNPWQIDLQNIRKTIISRENTSREQKRAVTSQKATRINEQIQIIKKKDYLIRKFNGIDKFIPDFSKNTKFSDFHMK